MTNRRTAFIMPLCVKTYWSHHDPECLHFSLLTCQRGRGSVFASRVSLSLQCSSCLCDFIWLTSQQEKVWRMKRRSEWVKHNEALADTEERDYITLGVTLTWWTLTPADGLCHTEITWRLLHTSAIIILFFIYNCDVKHFVTLLLKVAIEIKITYLLSFAFQNNTE